MRYYFSFRFINYIINPSVAGRKLFTAWKASYNVPIDHKSANFYMSYLTRKIVLPCEVLVWSFSTVQHILRCLKVFLLTRTTWLWAYPQFAQAYFNGTTCTICPALCRFWICTGPRSVLLPHTTHTAAACRPVAVCTPITIHWNNKTYLFMIMPLNHECSLFWHNFMIIYTMSPRQIPVLPVPPSE